MSTILNNFLVKFSAGDVMLECSCRERLPGVECSPHEREAQGGGGGGGGGGGEDFTDAALDTAGAEQRAAYEAAVVAHEEEEVRTVRSTVPRGVYIHRKVGEMEEME